MEIIVKQKVIMKMSVKNNIGIIEFTVGVIKFTIGDRKTIHVIKPIIKKANLSIVIF